MVKDLLVGAAIDEGARLLAELDRTQFTVDSMFWVQLPEVGRWRLVIGSPLVRVQGPRPAYERVGALLRESDIGLSLMNISAFSPDSVELASLLSVVETSGTVVAGESWLTFGEGVVYRWTAEALVGDLSCDLTQAELSQIWERERKPVSGPKPLFNLRGRHVTIRFHPQHGRLASLKDIKKAFNWALQKSGVYKDCRVDLALVE
jgi:hypothetical protein